MGMKSQSPAIGAFARVFMVLFVAVPLSGCPGFFEVGPAGKYSDASASMTLELKANRKATLTFLGQSRDCTYSAEGNKVNLSCGADVGNLAFVINSDGSLSLEHGDFPARLVRR